MHKVWYIMIIDEKKIMSDVPPPRDMCEHMEGYEAFMLKFKGILQDCYVEAVYQESNRL